MKELEVNAYPGVIALFLLNAEISCGYRSKKKKSEKVISIAAPYSVNHRNVNVDAIHRKKTYEYSLKDVYAADGFSLAERELVAIGDNLITPLVAIPFSIIEKNLDSLQLSAYQTTDMMLLEIVENTPIKTFRCIPPRVKVNQPVLNSARKSTRSKTTNEEGQGM